MFPSWVSPLIDIKPPSHKRATFVRPFSDKKKRPGLIEIAEIQKNLFLCDCSGSSNVAQAMQWLMNCLRPDLSWSLLVAQWAPNSYSDCSQFHWRSFVTSEKPMGDLGAGWETFERQSSTLWETCFLGEQAATVLTPFKNWRQPWRPRQPPNAPWMIKKTSERPLGDRWWPRKFFGCSRVVQ